MAIFDCRFLTGYLGIPQFERDTNRVTGGLNSVSKAAGKMRGNFANLAGAFTGIMAASRIKDVFMSIMTPTMKLEEAFAGLKALTNASASEMTNYRNEVLKVAKETSFGPLEVAEAMLELRRKTGSAEGAVKSLGATAQFAMASFGKMDIKQAAAFAGELSRAFNLAADRIPASLNKIAAAANWAGFGIEEFKPGVMGKVGVATRTAGYSPEEAFGTFAILKRVMPSAQRASTLYARMVSDLTRPAAEEAFRAMNIDIVGKSLPQIFMEAAPAWDKMGGTFSDFLTKTMVKGGGKAFTGRAKQTFESIMMVVTDAWRQNRDVFKELNAAMGDTGFLQRLAEAWQKTIGAGFQRMTEAGQVLALEIGSKLGPAFSLIVGLAEKLLNVFTAFISLPGVSFLAQIGAIVLMVKGGIWAFSAALQGASRIMSVVNHNLMQGSIQASAFGGAITRLRGAFAGLAVTSGLQKMGLGQPGMPSSVLFSAFPRMVGPGGAIGGYGSYASYGAGLTNITAVTKTAAAWTTVKAAAASAASAIGGIPALIAAGLYGLYELANFLQTNEALQSWYTTLEKNTRTGTFNSLMRSLLYIDAVEAYKKKKMEEALSAESKIRKAMTDEENKKKLEALQFGTQAFENVIRKLDAIMNYKPQRVQWNIASELASKFTGLKGLGPQETMAVRGSMLGLNEAQKIWSKGQSGKELSTSEGQELLGYLTAAGAVAQHIEMTQPGAFGGNLVARFRGMHKILSESMTKGVPYSTAVKAMTMLGEKGYLPPEDVRGLPGAGLLFEPGALESKPGAFGLGARSEAKGGPARRAEGAIGAAVDYRIMTETAFKDLAATNAALLKQFKEGKIKVVIVGDDSVPHPLDRSTGVHGSHRMR